MDTLTPNPDADPRTMPRRAAWAPELTAEERLLWAIFGPPEPRRAGQAHEHLYRHDLSTWWCRTCKTCTDYCSELNPT